MVFTQNSRTVIVCHCVSRFAAESSNFGVVIMIGAIARTFGPRYVVSLLESGSFNVVVTIVIVIVWYFGPRQIVSLRVVESGSLRIVRYFGSWELISLATSLIV
ncbi:hypothetical protein EUX98_g3414 [Antrodiella citrinella]|uniref:Uncharacterized protein n=1 Tax=Antrodiella citrinella TaxID=2447956 RepID=A0A4S4MZD3_9APHY|nr:hypothetical protein EUX98_g3414 [Antrodiella citrinella]